MERGETVFCYKDDITRKRKEKIGKQGVMTQLHLTLRALMPFLPF